MSNNPFGQHMPGAQPSQHGQPPGFPAPQQTPQGWGAPQGQPQQPQVPQGWGAPQGQPQPQQPPQGWGAPQGQPQQPQAPQGWGAPQGQPQQQAGGQWGGNSAPQFGGPGGAPPGFQQNMPTALPPGVQESGDSVPLIMKPGNFVLEYEKHLLSNQSATLFWIFRILESDQPEYQPGIQVKWIKKFSEAPGHWKWNKDAGWVLALVRPLMGFRDAASFQAQPGWDSFTISIIRGEARPELIGKRVRDIVGYQYKDGQVKVDPKRGQPFMTHDWRVI